MIERYRDGVVPGRRAGPGAGRGDGRSRRAGGRGSRELLDRAELTQALEEIWVRVRRLNRYVEETRPWDLAKDDESGRDRLDVVLYSLAEGLRVVDPAAARVHAGEPATGCSTALGEDRRELAAFGSRGGGQATEKLPPLFPKIETAAA